MLLNSKVEQTPLAAEGGGLGMDSFLQYCAILFADIVHSSEITVPTQKQTLKELIANIIDQSRSQGSFVFAKSWGDGLIVCMGSCSELGSYALGVRDRFRNTDWHNLGFPHSMQMRFGLDFQRIAVDGAKATEVSGAGVDRAARVEPITAPNQVFCTELFFKSLMSERVETIAGDDLGVRDLAKGAGKERLYCLRWNQEPQMAGSSSGGDASRPAAAQPQTLPIENKPAIAPGVKYSPKIGLFLDVDKTLTRNFIQQDYARALGCEQEYAQIESRYQQKEITGTGFGEELISLFRSKNFTQVRAKELFSTVALQPWADELLRLPIEKNLVSSGPSYYLEQLAQIYGIDVHNICKSDYFFNWQSGLIESCNAVEAQYKASFARQRVQQYDISIGIGDHPEFDGPFVSHCTIPLLTVHAEGYLHATSIGTVVILIRNLLG
jgi:phosphoserine phosphatase/class 3 adenylate cyclase